MSKPILLGSSGKSDPLVGVNNADIPSWSVAAQEWVAVPNNASGAAAGVFFFNFGNQTGVTPDSALPITTPGPSNPNTTPSLLGPTWNPSATTVTSENLTPQNTYVFIAGFVTPTLSPNVTSIPKGLWDFNIWARSTNAQSGTQVSMQARVYILNGAGTAYGDSSGGGGNNHVAAATSDEVFLYEQATPAQYILNVTFINDLPILATDRLYIEFYARKNVNPSRTIEFYFASNQPSHVHTTLPNYVNLATGVTGILPTTNGGTGKGTGSLPSINTVFAGASSGSPDLPTFRPLVVDDIPGLPYLPSAGGTLTGKLITATPANPGNAGFNLPPSVAPGTLVNGDLWTTSAGLFARIGGATKQFAFSTDVTSLIGTAAQVLVNGLSGSGNAQTGSVTLTLPTLIEPTAASTGPSFTLKGGDSTGVDVIGGNLVLSGGYGTNGNGSGGDVNISGGRPNFSGSGIYGSVNVGTSGTAAVVLGSSTIPTNLQGALTLTNATLSYFKTSSSDVIPLVPASSTTVTLQPLTQTSANGYGLTITGGPSTKTNGNGGTLTLTGGAKNGSGTAGALSLGATNTASVTVGASSIPTSIASATVTLANIAAGTPAATSYFALDSSNNLVKWGTPYDFSTRFPGTPGTSTIIGGWVVDRNVKLLSIANGGTHKFYITAVSASGSDTLTLTIKKNGSSIGTAIFTGGTSAGANGLITAAVTFASDVTLAETTADYLTIETQASAIAAGFSTLVCSLFGTAQ
jgi:hypothetical protein